MAEENKHMDDAFKRMSEEFKVAYNASFWDEAKAKLDDASLDEAFKAAALSTVAAPDFSAVDSVDDMFMDSAFVEASADQSVVYDASYFEQFMQNEGDLMMDEAFNEAAVAAVVDYVPEYWTDADQALQNEGLHYEYNSTYWQEARRLLDRSDRRIFFGRWSAVAAILLLLSFGGQYAITPVTEVDSMQANEVASEDAQLSASTSNPQVDALHETLLADRDFNAINEVNDQVSLALNTLQTVESSNQPLDQNVEDAITPIVIGDQQVIGKVITGQLPNTVLTERDLSAIDLSNRLAETNKRPNELTFQNVNKRTPSLIHEIGYARPIPTPEITIEKPKPTTMHSVAVLAQGGIGNRWGDFSFVPTFRSAIGIEYLVSSGKKLQNFEFGGSFVLNHIRQNRLTVEDRSVEYTPNATYKYWRKVQLKDFVTLNVNGLINYRIGPSHKVKFGAGVEYLTGARSNMSYVNDYSGQIKTVNNNWGVKDGLNKFDLRFMIGYEYEVSDRLALQLNSSFGVFDRTDNHFFKDEQSDREINVMLGLKYNFIRKLK